MARKMPAPLSGGAGIHSPLHKGGFGAVSYRQGGGSKPPPYEKDFTLFLRLPRRYAPRNDNEEKMHNA